MPQTTQSLLEKYYLLPSLYQAVLQHKAILFRSKNKIVFEDYIKKLNLRTDQGGKLYGSNLNVILDKLVKSNLLTPDQNCNPQILHVVTALSLNSNNPFISSILNAIKGSDFKYEERTYFNFNGDVNLRALHLAVHQNTVESFLKGKLSNVHHLNFLFNTFDTLFYTYPLDMNWVIKREPITQAFICYTKLKGFFNQAYAFPPNMEIWIDFYKKSSFFEVIGHVPLLRSRLLQIDLCLGLLGSVKKKCDLITEKNFYKEEGYGALAFFKGNTQEAIVHYEKGIRLLRPLMSKQEWFSSNLHSVLYILALICEDNPKAENEILNYKRANSSPIEDALDILFLLKKNNFIKANTLFKLSNLSNKKTITPFFLIIIDWVAYLIKPDKRKDKSYYLENKNKQHMLAAHFYAELLTLNATAADPDCLNFLQTSPYGDFRFFRLLKAKAIWEYTIEQLQKIIVKKPEQLEEAASEKRLVWLIDPSKPEEIVALEQKITKKGTWSVGRTISIKKLFEQDDSLNYLTSHDKAVIECIEENKSWYREDLYWNIKKAIMALINHPYVFHKANPTIHLELEKGEVLLQVEQIDKGFHLALTPFSDAPKLIFEKETTNRYRVIDFPEDAALIGQLLSSKGLTLPASAKDKVLDIIRNAKPDITIQTDVEDYEILTIPANTMPCIHFLPIREGLKMSAWIKPFMDQGPYCKAGEGKSRIIASIHTEEQGDIKQKAIRDFDQETANIQALIQNCPILSAPNTQTDIKDEWSFETTEACLEILEQLDAYQKKANIRMEWPKGQTFKLKKTLSSKNLSLSIKGSDYWFEYSGDVQIDEQNTLSIKKLLSLLEHSQGRFIKLEDGEFIALTDRFKKQLEDLKALSHGNKIYHLSANGLQILSEEANTAHVDEKWKQHLKKMASMEKHIPTLPSTFQANLREYQAEGFSYLSRLCNWGIGACLADDMGLGKTIQAIALLLEQAQKGPSIVVAPTSVCLVWFEELAKFAPTLTVHHLNVSDRETLIKSLDKMDILICSYHLLHQSDQILVQKKWQVVILDEAQAIKNPDTKRAKTAMQLKSQSRVALTGTPIENHLGELWSIFNFLNPGLLGSLTFFQSRYASPIEKAGDPVAKRALKNLVHPYILRRTKSEVLLELPPKTEQTIIIEPTKEEATFYEAVRLKALERVQQLSDEDQSHPKRFGILAEITRLRQACCHSSLVNEEMDIESSKIKTFIALAKNLIDNGHKALIFSQYVRYLGKIKSVLNQENISYQYLDGGTSIKERQASINAFQSGKGDLFLISLKAGGAGLTLTAADYVIILDPWWNPAVEDQALARAHRMGQERPVTVYRLIMKNTIEEKIIKLHKDKKDLADDLLSGSDISGKISEEELVKLIMD